MLARGGNHFLARYWQNLAESGGEESLILQNKPIGIEMAPKGHQKSAKAHQNTSTNLDRKKVRVTSVKGGGGGERTWNFGHLWRHLVDVGLKFWRPLDLGGSIHLAFLDVFGATAKK